MQEMMAIEVLFLMIHLIFGLVAGAGISVLAINGLPDYKRYATSIGGGVLLIFLSGVMGWISNNFKIEEVLDVVSIVVLVSSFAASFYFFRKNRAMVRINNCILARRTKGRSDDAIGGKKKLRLKRSSPAVRFASLTIVTLAFSCFLFLAVDGFLVWRIEANETGISTVALLVGIIVNAVLLPGIQPLVVFIYFFLIRKEWIDFVFGFIYALGAVGLHIFFSIIAVRSDSYTAFALSLSELFVVLILIVNYHRSARER